MIFGFMPEIQLQLLGWRFVSNRMGTLPKSIRSSHVKLNFCLPFEDHVFLLVEVVLSSPDSAKVLGLAVDSLRCSSNSHLGDLMGFYRKTLRYNEDMRILWDMKLPVLGLTHQCKFW